MRLFLVLIVFCTALPGFVLAQGQDIDALLNNKPIVAAPENIQEYANRFFLSCRMQSHPILPRTQVEALCGCVGTKIPDVFTLAQALAMDDPAGEEQRIRMLLFAYAPCIEEPIYHSIFDECMGSVENKYTMKNQKDTCGCLAAGVSHDMAEYAPKAIERNSRYNKKDVAPLSLIIDPKTYQHKLTYHNKRCTQYYELGIGRF